MQSAPRGANWHYEILSTFIKLPFAIKIFVLLFYTGFTLVHSDILSKWVVEYRILAEQGVPHADCPEYASAVFYADVIND